MAHDSSGLFSAIDTFNVTTGTGHVLSLRTLISGGYNVVLTYPSETDARVYLDPTAMGDTLAAFMDQGGGVVIGNFADWGTSIWEITGRYATEYMPFPKSVYPNVSGSLGTVHLPNHPIMAGVTSHQRGLLGLRAYVAAARGGRGGLRFRQHPGRGFRHPGSAHRRDRVFPLDWVWGSWSGDNTRLMLNSMCWAAGLCNENTGVEVMTALGNLPGVFALAPARPNPVLGTTEIRYQLPSSALVHIQVYNVAGQLVKTLVEGKQNAGYKSVTWNGRNDQGARVGSGVYLYRMEAGSFTATRKMVVVR